MASGGYKVAAWVVVGLVVLVCGEVAVAGPADDCTWHKRVPRFDIDHLPMHTNENNTSLAKIAAYISYTENNEPIYLPLQVYSYTAFKTAVGHRFIASSKQRECTTFDLVSVAGSPGSEAVEYLFADFYKPDGTLAQCYKKNPEGISFNSKTHYSCQKTISYPCYSDDTQESLVATLVLADLEFEFDSDPSMAARGRWSKPANTCA